MFSNYLSKIMNEQDEQLRTELMEGMLEYLEGNKTFRSILTIGITAHNKRIPTIPEVAEVVSQLNALGNQVSQGKSYSREYIKDTFTTMLEKLAK